MAVETVGLDGLDNLGIDQFNHLYWKGEQVVTQSMLDLPTWLEYSVGIAAIAVAVTQILKYAGVKPRRSFS